MAMETAFSMDTSSIKYGPGVTREVGWDMQEQGSRRVMVVTDRNLVESDAVAVTLESLKKYNIDTVLFDQTRVEPTDVSFKEAIKFAKDGKFDGFVAVGGGSSMDATSPASGTSTLAAAGSGSGTDDSKALEYGWRGRLNRASFVASSQSLPMYMTRMR